MRPKRTKNCDGETSWKMSTWKDDVGGSSGPMTGISAVETPDSATADLVSCYVVKQLISQPASQPEFVRQLLILFLHDSTALVGLGALIAEAFGSHSDTPHWVGFLWTGDRTVVHNTQHFQEKYRNSNLQSQQASGR